MKYTSSSVFNLRFLILVLYCLLFCFNCDSKSTHKSIPVSASNKFQWTASLEFPNPSQPLLLDVNADGNVDVVTAADSGKIQAFDGVTGNIIWSTSYSSEPSFSTPREGRFSTCNAQNIIYTTNSEILILRSMNGDIVSSFGCQGDLGIEPYICDLDDSTTYVIVSSLLGSSAFHVQDRSIKWYDESFLTSPYGSPTEFCYADSLFFLATTLQNDSFFVAAVNSGTGSLLWQSYLCPPSPITTPGTAICDLDNDGVNEIISCFGAGSVIAYNIHTGEEAWRYQYDMTGIYASPVVTDLDSNNTLEILISLYDANCISILNTSGVELDRIPLKGHPLRAPTLYDLNGDDVKEIIISSGVYIGHIQIFDGCTFEETARIEHGCAIPSGVEITDLNNDGEPELLYSSIGGRLFVLPVSSVL